MAKKSIYDGLSPEAQKALGKALSEQAGLPPRKKTATKSSSGTHKSAKKK